MQEIEYLNEHIWPGRIGQFFIVLSFVASLFSATAYYISTKQTGETNIWKRPARIAFWTHGLSVVGVIAMLLYILTHHLYEYHYAHDHLNNAMPMRYVFSCLWEGQEGSFLLWSFWHVVLGCVLMLRSKTWEPYVMCIVALVQAFLASMLLGVYFGDFQFGSNPFLLLREMPVNYGLPWTQNAEYLSLKFFQDGDGLNALLQNYWMTIHPPTLFLGFASTLIPFAFAIAGLWKRDYSGWVKPAIPWAFFGVMILGTGILMGGAWAYEALGFGGFWAWDPVENASLVPWLTLLASAHLMVINQRKQTSLFATLILTLSTFILILYSTFLTRSGVLGDSSVHSFVESGILAQLLVYLLFFTMMSTVLLVREKKIRIAYIALCLILFLIALGNLLSYNSTLSAEQLEALLPGEDTWVPLLCLLFIIMSLTMMVIAYRKHYLVKAENEEATWSREFWMFIGTVILTFSALHITFLTSVNVVNIFLTPFEGFFAWLHHTTGWKFALTLAQHKLSAPGEQQRFEVYHMLQVPLAFLLFIVVACGQWLRYKNTDKKMFAKKIWVSMLTSLILTALIAWAADLHAIYHNSEEQFINPNYIILLLVWACMFAICANADYAWRVLRGKLDMMGASIAHIGFAMLIAGAVISTWQSYFISSDATRQVNSLNKPDNKNAVKFAANEDLMIFQGDTLAMGPYMVHYKEKSKNGQRLYVAMEYFERQKIWYHEGDYVQVEGQPFRALSLHEAGNSFFEDATGRNLWAAVTPAEVDAHATGHLQGWKNGLSGEKLFTLEPTILLAPKGDSREPSTKHFLTHDIYTFIKATDTNIKEKSEKGYEEPESKLIELLQPVHLTQDITLLVDSVVELKDIPENLPAGLKGKRAFCSLYTPDASEQVVVPMLTINDTIPFTYPVEAKSKKLLLAMQEKESKIELTVQKHSSLDKDLLVYTAQVFPFINVLWLGCIVMVIGTTMAIRHRIKLARGKNQ
ncbi:MAG: cytochrome c biogenesis protein CcsA [Flavobacteriales bacterium]